MVIKIKDVAKLAGVGIGTVSRVLNNSPSVKETTRQRVNEAIRQLGYKPDLAARSMGRKTRENRTNPNDINPDSEF